jgi:quinolinate synthase
MKTVVLAHYYTTKEVQDLADHVGDSLDLAQKAQQSDADRIIFAGVRFMAETAKLLNPRAEVILPDWNSTCSLVEQTDTDSLQEWLIDYKDHTHVMYINSSVAQKAMADYIVTSRNVEPLVVKLLEAGKKVVFSPDRNMGNWLNRKLGIKIPSWTAVCEVHDQFDKQRMKERFASYEDEKTPYLIAHPESPMPILDMADYIGSTAGMLKWVDEIQLDAPDEVKLDIFVATEFELVRMMRERRPDLNIWQVPVIADCRCNTCPYMKLNSREKVLAAVEGKGGTVIDYLTANQIERARIPVERMMHFNKTGEI